MYSQMERKRCCVGWEPVIAMLAVDMNYGVVNILIKKSLNDGLDGLVLVTLRQLTATAFLAPIAYFLERKTRPKLTPRITFYIFLSALLGGSLAQYLFFLGLQYTSATFACAFLNITPVFTFLVALPFRMETVHLKTTAGRAKVVATLVCLGGTMALMFYRGMALTYTSQATAAEATAALHRSAEDGKAVMRWTVGSVLLFGCCFTWGGWFLVQSVVVKHYPAIYSATTMMFFLSSVQAAVLTFAIKRDLSIWIVKGKLEIITIFFSGAAGSVVGTLTMTWCVVKRGPVFTAAFSPLIQIVVAIIDFSFLEEPLYLGSVLGSVLVVLGLYLLLWAKQKEIAVNAMKPVEGRPDVGGRSNGQVEPV